MNGLYEVISEENRSAIFVNVDIDEFDEIAADNAVLSIPLIVHYEKSKAVDRIGSSDEKEVRAFVKKYA